MRWSGGQVVTGVLMIAIVAVASTLLFGHDGARGLLALRAERQRLGETAVQLIEQNGALREQVRQMKDDDRFLETLARSELGFVRSDEVVYRFGRRAGAR